MSARMSEVSPSLVARAAGAFYLVIIVCGIWSEVAVRGSLVVAGDAAATAANIAASEGLFRLSFAADTVMAISDVALAVLLLVLLAPVDRMLSVMAAVFRLIQAATIAASLVFYAAAPLIVSNGASWGLGTEQSSALALIAIDLHAHGYDLGLIFFGVSCLVLGYLISRSGYLPGALGYLAMAAGVVYLIGSFTRFLLPEQLATVQPIYIVALVSELALCLWLLIRGVDAKAWSERAAEARSG